MKKLFVMLICIGGLVLGSCEDDRRSYSGGHGSGLSKPGVLEGDGTEETKIGTENQSMGTTADTLRTGTGTER
jgi:hypothetical protein